MSDALAAKGSWVLGDGAWRGERGGSAFWGGPGSCSQPIPGPELGSELLQQLLQPCRGRRLG